MALLLVGRSAAGKRFRRRKEARKRAKGTGLRHEAHERSGKGRPWWLNSNSWQLNAVMGAVSKQATAHLRSPSY